MNISFNWSGNWALADEIQLQSKCCKVKHTGKIISQPTYKMDEQLGQINKEKDLERKMVIGILEAIRRTALYKSEEVITKLYCNYQTINMV